MPSSTMPHSVRAVLFDYGMVLTTGPDPGAWRRMMELTGFDEETLHKAYWEFRRSYDRGDLTGRAYWRAVAGWASGGTSGGTLSEETTDALIAADTRLWTQPNAPMIEWALALQRAGVRTGILSNLGDAMTDGVLAAFPWLAGFHHRTWSHTLNLAKPEAAIYAHAASGLETPAERILFIDDREDNLAAAAEAGMQTMLYTTQAQFEGAMREMGYGGLLAPEPVMA